MIYLVEAKQQTQIIVDSLLQLSKVMRYEFVDFFSMSAKLIGPHMKLFLHIFPS